MKAIELKDKFILKEERRDVSRAKNILHIEMLLELKYGATFTKDLADKLTTFVIMIDKGMNSQNWAKTKDTTRDELTDIFYNDLVRYYDIYLSLVQWEQKTAEERGYRAITQKTADGEEYTIHEINPNPHVIRFQREQFKSPFSGHWDSILGHLYSKLQITSLDDIKLIEL